MVGKGAFPKLLTVLAVLSLAGCNGAFWGNLVVLCLTVGIFFATLSLGRRADTASPSTTTRS